jgi:hypothetical protein
LILDGLIVDHLSEQSREQWQIWRQNAGSVISSEAQHGMGKGEVCSSHIWMTEPVKGRLDVLESDLQRQRVQNVPDQLRRKRGGIPDLVGGRRWEDHEIAHLLVIHVKRKVGLKQLICVKIDPVDMRRDTSHRHKRVVFLLRLKVRANANDRSI